MATHRTAALFCTGLIVLSLADPLAAAPAPGPASGPGPDGEVAAVPIADVEQSVLEEAISELTFFNFEKAYDLFRDAQEQAEPAGSKAWQRSVLGRAMAAQSITPATQAMLNEADELYRTLAETSPETPLAARAVLNRGRLAEVRDYGGDVVDLEAAQGFYRRVFEGWPELDIADEAALRYADTWVQQFEEPGAVEKGEAFLSQWMVGRESRPFAAVLWEYLSSVRHNYLADYRGSVEAFQKADELGLAEPSLAGGEYWRVAQLADRQLNDLPVAIHFYTKLITDAARSGRAFNARLELERIQKDNPGMNVKVPEIKLFGGKDGASPGPDTPTEPPSPQVGETPSDTPPAEQAMGRQPAPQAPQELP